jgi:hypothetical protein
MHIPAGGWTSLGERRPHLYALSLLFLTTARRCPPDAYVRSVKEPKIHKRFFVGHFFQLHSRKALGPIFRFSQVIDLIGRGGGI